MSVTSLRIPSRVCESWKMLRFTVAAFQQRFLHLSGIYRHLNYVEILCLLIRHKFAEYVSKKSLVLYNYLFLWDDTKRTCLDIELLERLGKDASLIKFFGAGNFYIEFFLVIFSFSFRGNHCRGAKICD